MAIRDKRHANVSKERRLLADIDVAQHTDYRLQADWSTGQQTKYHFFSKSLQFIQLQFLFDISCRG